MSAKFTESHIWAIIRGYLVSTADTADKGLETMVFPAEQAARLEQVTREMEKCEFVWRGAPQEAEHE